MNRNLSRASAADLANRVTARRAEAVLRRLPLYTVLLVASFPVSAEEAPVAQASAKPEQVASADADAKGKAANPGGGAKALSGMSILGNQEAPKALVIVPWKSSQLGDSLGLSNNLDDARRPVDKDVFMRELQYYEIRSN